MKKIITMAIASSLLSPLAFAIPPVTLSGPSPAISPYYAGGASSIVTYTITNNVPKKLPVTISGVSNGISRTAVSNDCGSLMPAGPSSCNIGIAISPAVAQIGSTINQTLQVNYQGRSPLTSPIAFSVIQPVAYVTPSPGTNSILQFLLDTVNGSFTTSQTTYTSISKQFGQLAFATVGGVQYGYTVDQNGFVYQCNINLDGTFSSCSATPQSPPAWAPHGIAFATVNGVQYAYITDVGVGEIYQCSLNSDGSFSNCSLAISTAFNAPYGIAFATISGIQYAYIAEAVTSGGPTGAVYQCTLNSNGSLNACTATPQLGAPAWIAYSVTFSTTGGTQYAYVTDNGTSPTTGHVYQCSLNNDGSFNVCTATPTVSPPSNWVPSYVAFATFGGTKYAYVANYQGPSDGGMFVCTVNNSGLFSSCTETPASPPVPWQPVGVAFRFG